MKVGDTFSPILEKKKLKQNKDKLFTKMNLWPERNCGLFNLKIFRLLFDREGSVFENYWHPPNSEQPFFSLYNTFFSPLSHDNTCPVLPRVKGWSLPALYFLFMWSRFNRVHLCDVLSLLKFSLKEVCTACLVPQLPLTVILCSLACWLLYSLQFFNHLLECHQWPNHQGLMSLDFSTT